VIRSKTANNEKLRAQRKDKAKYLERTREKEFDRERKKIGEQA
jgi:hypothetical protein